jgi:hypothetical protein
MNTTFEERIRARAYELWQPDGSLEDCADEYWRMAREPGREGDRRPGR